MIDKLVDKYIFLYFTFQFHNFFEFHISISNRESLFLRCQMPCRWARVSKLDCNKQQTIDKLINKYIFL